MISPRFERHFGLRALTDLRVPSHRNAWFMLHALALVTCTACDGEPVALFLTLDQPPAVSNSDSVQIVGTVTRIPPEIADRLVPASVASAITITATGGTEPVGDTAAADGTFSLAVPLRRNARNALLLVARDARGNLSDTLALEVRQDGTPPIVVSATPAPGQDGVTLDPVVEVRFSEPVVLTNRGADLRLVTAAQTVPGSFLLSSDSLVLSFFPGATLLSNSVYALNLSEITDAAGNPLGGDAACFVTRRTGVEQLVVDPTGDVFGDSPSPADVREMRFSTHGALFTGVLRFTTPRSFDTLATNNLFATIDFDIDQDSLTGFQSFKDFVYQQFGLGSQLSSGTGVEYLVGLDRFTLGDSAFVGRWLPDLEFEPVMTFIPDFCSDFVGFAFPVALLTDGDGLADDGNFNLVAFAANFGAINVSLEAAPNAGHVSVTFAGQFTAPPLGITVAPGGARRLQLGPRIKPRD